MESIQKLMDKVKAQIKDQLPTPEQVALGRWIVDGQNSVCLPHCPICNGLGRIWVSFGKTADCPNFPAAKMFRDPRYGLLDTDRGLCWEALIETEANRPAVKAIREALEAYLFDRARDGRFEIVHMEGESLRPVMG